MTHRSTTTKRRGLSFRLFTETIAELKKVVWLSRREVVYLTALVLLVAVIVGLILGVIDFGFTKLVNNVLLGG